MANKKWQIAKASIQLTHDVKKDAKRHVNKLKPKIIESPKKDAKTKKEG